MQIVPRTQVPELVVPKVGGGTIDLAESKPQRFTLLIFYRGFH